MPAMTEGMTPMLDAALEYAQSGFSVIPVSPSKTPLISWAEFHTRRATVKEIFDWWEQFPDANVGIVTGAISGIVVIDVEAGGSEDWPPTAKVRTGSGGCHLYYKHPGYEVKNAVRIRPLTDVRGDRGYVVAPPSLHASGKNYEWEVSIPFAPYPLMEKPKNDWNKVAEGVGKGMPGGRHGTAAAYIGKLLAAFKEADWEGAVWNTISTWNKSNKPPLNQEELRRTFKDIAAREREKRARTKTSSSHVDIVDFGAVLSASEQEINATDPGSIMSFGYKFLDDVLVGILPGDLILVGGVTGTGKTTFAMNLVRHASRSGHRALVYSLEDRKEDYGMRMLWREMNRLALTGETEQKTADGAPRIYTWNEFRKNSPEDKDISRFKASLQEAKHSLTASNANLLFGDVGPGLTLESMFDSMYTATDKGVKLFLLDHLHYLPLLDAKFSKADVIETVMVKVRAFQRETQAAVLLISHYKKNLASKHDLQGFKDSSSISQNATSVLQLTRDSFAKDSQETRTGLPTTHLYITKNRGANGTAAFELPWDPITGDFMEEHIVNLTSPIQLLPESANRKVKERPAY